MKHTKHIKLAKACKLVTHAIYEAYETCKHRKLMKQTLNNVSHFLHCLCYADLIYFANLIYNSNLICFVSIICFANLIVTLCKSHSKL